MRGVRGGGGRRKKTCESANMKKQLKILNLLFQNLKKDAPEVNVGLAHFSGAHAATSTRTSFLCFAPRSFARRHTHPSRVHRLFIFSSRR
jgi:hypothetical protein